MKAMADATRPMRRGLELTDRLPMLGIVLTGFAPAHGEPAMPQSTFDTHAAAIVNTVRDASVDHAGLATKGDLAELRAATRADIEALRSEMRWMLAFQAALILAIAAKLFGIV